MINHTNILIKGQWYGCRNDAGYPIGDYGTRGSPIDNPQFGYDIRSSAAGAGRPKVGESRSHGVFCGSGFHPNGGQGKE